MSLSDNLKKLRNRLGLTQDQVSTDLQMNRATYAHYETGRREPDIETLKLLANYYKVTTDYLLETNIADPITHSTKPSDRKVEYQYSISDKLSYEIDKLSPESQEELKKLIELYKIRDMQKRNTEISDELATLD